jgi:hypothetical protein
MLIKVPVYLKWFPVIGIQLRKAAVMVGNPELVSNVYLMFFCARSFEIRKMFDRCCCCSPVFSFYLQTMVVVLLLEIKQLRNWIVISL